MAFKLGKRPARHRLDTVALSDFLPAATAWPAVKPRGWEYAKGIVLNMLGNDVRGNCAIVAAMNFAMVQTANTGNPLTPTTALALQAYSAITGFDPSQDQPDGSNPTDQGTDVQNQLFPYWRTTGIPMLNKNGKEVLHTILGTAALDLSSVAQQRWAVDVFGGTMMGFSCPEAIVGNVTNWNDPSGSSAGGHEVYLPGQGADGWHAFSWAASIPGTWRFSMALADEIDVVVTPFWLNAQGESPSEFNLNGLLAAMKAVSANTPPSN